MWQFNPKIWQPWSAIEKKPFILLLFDNIYMLVLFLTLNHYLLFLVQMLPRPVQHETALACQHISTKITRIAENVWEMLRLHMVSGHSSWSVRKSFTQSAVVLVLLKIFPHKLWQLRRVLKCLAWEMFYVKLAFNKKHEFIFFIYFLCFLDLCMEKLHFVENTESHCSHW